ncbi:MAG: site-specific integrase [Bacteroidales bacterium]|nr:site-specific integrase [Bacteroidales bacterium]
MAQTFNQVAALWKEEKRKYVKKSTYSVYLQLCRCCILPSFGSRSSSDINEESIQAFADDLLAKGYAVKTIKDILLVVKMILRHGEKIGAWPHIEYKIYFHTQTEIHPSLATFSLQHQQKLFHYLKDNFSFRNLGILICLHSGLRIGEVCGLQWSDLNVDAGIIHVKKTVQRIYLSDDNVHEYYLSIDTPKTASSVRDIPMSKELKSIISPFRKVTNANNYVLSNTDAPLEPRSFRSYFYRLLKNLDIPPIRFHALRHSFATRCIESKCDYKTVSVILGHASISTTLDLYVHPGYKEKKLVIDRMVKCLG